MTIGSEAKCVYIILNQETERVKIGFTNDINRRLKSLTYQGGCKMRVLYSSLPIYDFGKIELLLHAEFKEHRYIGEWFDINPYSAIKRLKKLCEESELCKIVVM